MNTKYEKEMRRQETQRRKAEVEQLRSEAGVRAAEINTEMRELKDECERDDVWGIVDTYQYSVDVSIFDSPARQRSELEAKYNPRRAEPDLKVEARTRQAVLGPLGLIGPWTPLQTGLPATMNLAQFADDPQIFRLHTIVLPESGTTALLYENLLVIPSTILAKETVEDSAGDILTLIRRPRKDGKPLPQ